MLERCDRHQPPYESAPRSMSLSEVSRTRTARVATPPRPSRDRGTKALPAPPSTSPHRHRSGPPNKVRGAKNALRSVDGAAAEAHPVGVTQPIPGPLDPTPTNTPSTTVIAASSSRVADASRRWLRPALTVAGPVIVVTVAWSTANLTEAMQIANVALVLAAVTVAVALTTSIGGVTTSVAGALALNYFHTEPVHSLRIHDAGDVATVLVLGALGLGVSTLTEHRMRSVARVRYADRAAGARVDLHVEVLRPVVDVWSEAVTACSADLALVDCRVATSADDGLPHIALHRKVIDDSARFVLPATGAIVEVSDPRLGLRLVLVPRQGWGAVDLDRRVVTAFVDHAGVALTPLGR